VSRVCGQGGAGSVGQVLYEIPASQGLGFGVLCGQTAAASKGGGLAIRRFSPVAGGGGGGGGGGDFRFREDAGGMASSARSRVW